MKKKQTHTFDAPIEQVWAMFHDPASHVAKFEFMGHKNIEVLEEEVTDDALRLVVGRDVTVDLPGFAKKVLSPTNHVVSTDEWADKGDGTYGGTFVLETKGAPVHISGATHIEADGDDRTTYEIEVEVKINVPLIGGKLTRWAEGDVENQTAQEFAAGDKWLADHA